MSKISLAYYKYCTSLFYVQQQTIQLLLGNLPPSVKAYIGQDEDACASLDHISGFQHPPSNSLPHQRPSLQGSVSAVFRRGLGREGKPLLRHSFKVLFLSL